MVDLLITFQVGTLAKLPAQLIEAKNFDVALAISKLNIKNYP